MKRITYWPQAVLGACEPPLISVYSNSNHNTVFVPVPFPFPITSPSTSPSPVSRLPRTKQLPPFTPVASAIHLFFLPPKNKQIKGLAFNWGALLGWSAVSGAVYWPVAGALYTGGVFWTLVYDSIYAHQDKTDDVRVGIRSTALLFGERTRSVLTAFSASSMGCIALAGYLNAQGAPFFIGTGLAAAQLARIIQRTDFDDRESCGKGFVACRFVGFWIWMGALGDYIWLQLRTDEEPSIDSVSHEKS